MDKINPSTSQKHIASGAYSKLIEKAAPPSRTESILRSICRFLGIHYYENKDRVAHPLSPSDQALKEDFEKVAEEVEDLFGHLCRKDHEKFNEGVLALRVTLTEIGQLHADKLPDKFSANALIDYVFKEVAKELPPEDIAAILQGFDDNWNKYEADGYDYTAMSAILKGIRDAVIEGAQPRIILGEEALINLNTRIECFGSHFQATEAKDSDKKKVGSGATHSVYSLPYAVGYFKGEEKSERIKAFKPIDEEEVFKKGMRHFPEMLGLSTEKNMPVRTRFLERNLVVSALDNKLNFGVIARTQPAIHNGERGIVMELYAPDKEGAATDVPKLASVESFTSLSEAHRDTMKDPHCRRDSVSLQLIDFITGQVDRHEGNYLILVGEGNKYLGLRGIDNDASSGAKIKPSYKDFFGLTGYAHQVGLPHVVDRQQYEAVMALKDSDLDDLCKNRLTPAEIKANKGRLALLKDHLRSLDQNSQIIDASDDCKHWGEENVFNLLTKRDPKMRHTSYYGRECFYTSDLE